jgi:hypothetical protein
MQLFQLAQHSQLSRDCANQIVVRETQPVEVSERPDRCWDRATEAVASQIQQHQTIVAQIVSDLRLCQMTNLARNWSCVFIVSKI